MKSLLPFPTAPQNATYRPKTAIVGNETIVFVPYYANVRAVNICLKAIAPPPKHQSRVLTLIYLRSRGAEYYLQIFTSLSRMI